MVVDAAGKKGCANLELQLNALLSLLFQHVSGVFINNNDNNYNNTQMVAIVLGPWASHSED